MCTNVGNSVNVGDVVRCVGELRDVDTGELVDPTTVFFWVRNPAGVLTTYQHGVDSQLVKSATGIYYVDLDLDSKGHWWYGFYSTGTTKAASTDTKIEVSGSRRQ